VHDFRYSGLLGSEDRVPPQVRIAGRSLDLVGVEYRKELTTPLRSAVRDSS